MIVKVFQNIGDRLTTASAYKALLALYADEIYPHAKAAGSLGGAVRSGFIVLNGNMYERVR